MRKSCSYFKIMILALVNDDTFENNVFKWLSGIQVRYLLPSVRKLQ